MNKKLLVIGLRWPEPDSTAAGVRMLQLLEFFIREGYKITFASSAAETQYSFPLEILGIQKQAIQLNHTSFDIFISDLQPNIVLFDRFLTEEQFGWRVAEQVPNALRILDAEDLHSLRHVREQYLKKQVPFTAQLWKQDDKTKREIASIYRCDISLIISSFEMELLLQELRIDKNLLLHLPFMEEELPKKPDWNPFEARNDFIFIGGGKHTPNIDAIKQLKTEIWPLIHQQLPEAKLHIYGSYLPQQILEFNRPEESFYVHGRVENVGEVMCNAKICLAPLRFGAGIKGKLLQAMKFGTPSITTPIGAEGMHGDLPWNGSIATNPAAFARAAVKIYSSKNKWEMAQAKGITLINAIYSKSKLQKTLNNTLKRLQQDVQKHRDANFIGSLLQHQTLQSTKFMSKWIEAKNK
ncbi:glycosyltransferase [Maribacter sp. 2210JD10-5]|uniref:glycosyltransferase n=1 Tax=Maribacter sp. 2210JD10-5 TaxID=3386272 RepID=UPI0039BC21E5